MSRRAGLLPVGIILGLSGFASLVYEILWIRYFSYLIGGTVISLSLVSAVFLGGLALGYRYLGRPGDRLNNPLRFYVWLELGIALFSLLPLSVHGFLPQLVDPLFLALSTQPLLLYTLQFLLVCLLVLPSTICMGGTVPVILGAFRDTPLATALARFYCINTTGGALGVLTAVFVLLPRLGATATHLFAITLTLLSAASAYLLSRRQAPNQIDASAPEAGHKVRLAPSLATLTCLCGFYILACEILWSRLLMLYLGNTIFAFGIILGIVLIAIAAGSLLLPKLPNRLTQSWLFAALLLLLMSLSVAVPALYYDQAAYLFYRANLLAGSSWSALVGLQLATVLLLIGIPTFCSGLFFPMIAALSAPSEGCRSRIVGRIGFWNTIGTIFGSLIAAFWILPAFGLRNGFLLLALFVFALGLPLCLLQIGRVDRGRAWRWGVGLALFIALPWGLNRPWDEKLIHSGIYLYTPYYQEVGDLKKGLGRHRLIYTRHDRESSVSINENRSGERFMTINGKVDASSGRDVATQYLLAHLPMLHHPDPGKVLVIGFGSGATLGSAGLYPADQLDCLEISPAVVDASRYFAELNRDILTDPRVDLRISDGMYDLRTGDMQYDVVISEPSNPWQRGNANLFSLDFYRQVRSHLGPRGIFCQWIPTYDLSPEHLKSALATFQTSFPYSLVFLNRGDLLVLGSAAPISQLPADSPVPAGVQRQLATVEIQGVGDIYRSRFLYPGDRLHSTLESTRPNSLDRSALEFAARPLFTSGLVGPFGKDNIDWLNAAKQK